MIPQRTIKLVVIGAAGVGKTSMRGQYISQRFSTGYRATIGADFITKMVKVDDASGEMVTLQIWDTAGQERFSSLSSAFFRGADAALLVFDVNAPDTLHALKKWWLEFKVHAPLEDDELGNFCCVVVGNKVDLGEGRVSVSQAESFLDTLIPPDLYRDNGEESDEEDDPLSASQLTATPTRINSRQALQTHQLLSPSSSLSISQPRSKSRSRSTDPNLTRSIYASSSVSGLSIYHTPSSSVYDPYLSARTSSSSAAESFFSAISSSSRPSWRVYPHSPSPAPPIKSPSHSKHSHFHSHNNNNNTIHRNSLSSSSSTPSPPLLPHLPSSSHPHSHLRLELEPPSDSSTEVQAPPDTGPRLFFASAKTGEGVNDVFEYVAKRVVRQWDWETEQEQKRRVGEDDDDEYVRIPGTNHRRKRRKSDRNGNGNGNGNGLNGNLATGGGGGLARSWSGGMTVTLNSLNGVAGSIGSMRGAGGSNCCTS
ncbi:ras-domain-containing protein [Lentinula raphanica]|uniref:Ras-domain-containing protein n=1 Tax=Lentinula raphanica TaxID=153919 RepID=A0AA38UI64_9AGAR|nr:ras-domain-containing protein [Lentinula raphanica]